MQQLMLKYFTRDVVYLPQQNKFFRFKIGDTVKIDLRPQERKNLAFKYSLNKGMFFVQKDFKKKETILLFRKTGKFIWSN